MHEGLVAEAGRLNAQVSALCESSHNQHLSSPRCTRRIHLPLELIYHVLDQLATEPKLSRRQRSLAHCTLVCRTWLHYVSRLLLSSINVDRWDPTTCQWVTLAAFLDYAKSSPRLRLYVTSVSESLESLCAMPLEDIHQTLPNVRELIVRGQHRPPHAVAVRPSAIQIGTLELNGMRADAFSTCLSHFASIDHLRLVQPYRYTFGFNRPVSQMQKPRVVQVSFEDMGLGARDPFLILQSILDPSSLRIVSVTHKDDACAWYHGDAILEALDAFLREVGQEIRSLSLDMAHFRGGELSRRLRNVPSEHCYC